MQRNKYIFDVAIYIFFFVLIFVHYHKNIRNIPDDAFITYKYAQNFISGRGLVFNVGEHYYGSTAMGFALLLGSTTLIINRILGFFSNDFIEIPGSAILLTGLSIFLISICWHNIIRQYGLSISTWITSLAIGLYFFSCYYSNFEVGMEAHLYFALLFCSSYLFIFSKRAIVSGILLAISTAIRPDSVLFAIILFSLFAVDFCFDRQSGKDGLRAVLISSALFGIGVLLWEIFLYFYFHSWTPDTMMAKKAQVYLGYWPVFNLRSILSGIDTRGFPGFFFLFALMLGVYSFIAKKVFEKKIFFENMMSLKLLKFGLLWLLFGLGLIAAYTSFHITTWLWYEVPIYFALINVLLSGGIPLFFERKAIIRNRKIEILVVSAIILIGLGMAPKAFGFINYWWKTPVVNQHLTSYDPIINYLR